MLAQATGWQDWNVVLSIVGVIYTTGLTVLTIWLALHHKTGSDSALHGVQKAVDEMRGEMKAIETLDKHLTGSRRAAAKMTETEKLLLDAALRPRPVDPTVDRVLEVLKDTKTAESPMPSDLGNEKPSLTLLLIFLDALMFTYVANVSFFVRVARDATENEGDPSVKILLDRSAAFAEMLATELSKHRERLPDTTFVDLVLRTNTAPIRSTSPQVTELHHQHAGDR